MPSDKTQAANDASPRLHGRLIRFREVASRTCLSKSEIYRRIAAGTFPASVRLGLRAVAWYEAEIDEWIRALAQQSRAAAMGVRK